MGQSALAEPGGPGGTAPMPPQRELARADLVPVAKGATRGARLGGRPFCFFDVRLALLIRRRSNVSEVGEDRCGT